MKRGTVVLLALLPALAACSGQGDPAPPAPRPTGPLYSPNGEPLSGGPLGHPSCQDALGRWFDHLDTSHTGAIDLAAFLADARHQFAAMDLNHDGQITPDELARYRVAYMADLRVADANEEDDTLRPDQLSSSASKEKAGGHAGVMGSSPPPAGSTTPVLSDQPAQAEGIGANMPGASMGKDGRDPNHMDTSSLELARDRPDPVMIADVTLHNRVTLAEFLDYARANFAGLDTNHDGHLSKGELARSCAKQ
jgi:hypothetical protein